LNVLRDLSVEMELQAFREKRVIQETLSLNLCPRVQRAYEEMLDSLAGLAWTVKQDHWDPEVNRDLMVLWVLRYVSCFYLSENNW